MREARDGEKDGRVPLIVRTWRGSTSLEDADGYFEYLQETGVREYRKTPGNAGVWVLRRTDGERAEFLVLSIWESMEAVRAFSSDPGRAVFYPEDEKYLVEFDRDVEHYDLLLGPADCDGEA